MTTGIFNSINANATTPLIVSQGGTGVASTTAYAVVCGGTTSTGAVQSIASVGTSGQVLTSNGAGALPTFQAAGGGSGTVLSVQIFTSGSGTYTPTAGANYIWVRAVGGGGGGGGASATTNGHFSSGSCGGSGGYAEYWGAAASLAYSVGAAGAGGVAASAGSDGGATTLGTAGAQINVGGGLGGLHGTSFLAVSFASLLGGSGGTATTGSLLIPGTSGDATTIMLISGSTDYFVTQGAGPASMLGLAIQEQVSKFTLVNQVSNGLTLNVGYGSGGGGAASYRNTTTASGNGGAGRSGCIIITEYS
jgi:hypothetical protein